MTSREWSLSTYIKSANLIRIIRSALLNAGHSVSRSHACPGSLKTDASHSQLHDIYRSWIKIHPVKLENISEGSPARRLLAKEHM